MSLSIKTLLAIASVTMIFYSCRKEIPDCSQNCSEFVFSGFVYDKSLNVPLPNQKVKIILYQSGNCLICLSKIIASGQSNSNGYFSIISKFDSSLLNEYGLLVSITAPDNYINNAQPIGPGIPESKDNLSSQYFSTIDTAAFKNLRFDFYPRALLKVNLHRTSNTIQQYPYLNQSYTFDNRTSVWGLKERATNIDTTLTIYTAANIFTKIVSSKQQSPTVVTTKIDSIKCLSNANNSIDITY